MNNTRKQFLKTLNKSYCLIILCGIAGCGPRKDMHKVAAYKKMAATLTDPRLEQFLVTGNEELSQLEAQLTDIPSFLGSTMVMAICMDDKRYFHYRITAPLQDIISFYEAQMEYCGWRLMTRFEGLMSSFLYERPGHYAVLSIAKEQRPDKSGPCVLEVGVYEVMVMIAPITQSQ